MFQTFIACVKERFWVRFFSYKSADQLGKKPWNARNFKIFRKGKEMSPSWTDR